MSSALPTIEYQNRSDQPWPRILRIIAIMTLIYTVSRLGVTIFQARFLWRGRLLQSVTESGAENLWWFIDSVIEVLVGIVLIIGAVQLLARGARRLIAVGLAGMIVLWFAASGIAVILRPASFTGSMLLGSIVFAITQNIFPVAAILLLRASRMK